MGVTSQTIGASLANIRTLEPETRKKVADFVAYVLSRLQVPMLVYSGTRSYADQWELRKKHLAGGPIAAAVGHSWHNFGRAVDMVPILPSGQEDWNSALWPQLISIAKGYGLTSGQSFGDTVHFFNEKGPSKESLRLAKPVPAKYQEIESGVPKDIEAKPFTIPGWLLWTAAGAASLGLLAYLTRDKN